MASDIDNLKSLRSNYIQQLLDLSTSANRKLSYSIDGQSVSWTEYQKFLTEQLALVNAQIQALAPYLVVSRGRS